MRSERLRDGQLTSKDMAVLRENESALAQHKSTRGVLKDYSMQHDVEIYWDMNEEAQTDLIFTLRVDDYEVVLDKEEVLRVLRWV